MSRILIVDDDEAMRSLLRRTMERSGHQPTEVSGGAEAIRTLETRQFDAVVTDLLMPDQDGIELILHIRRTHPKLPIVAISGGGRVAADDYLEMARMLGAGRVLQKPFDPAELLQALEAVLRPG